MIIKQKKLMRMPNKQKKLKNVKKGKKESEESESRGLVSSTTATRNEPKMGSGKVKAQGKGIVRPTTTTTTTKSSEE